MTWRITVLDRSVKGKWHEYKKEETGKLTLQFIFLTLDECGAESVDLVRQILVVVVVQFDVVVLYAAVVENVACPAALQIDGLGEEEYGVLFDEALHVLLNSFFIHGIAFPDLDAVLSSDTNDLTIKFVVEENCDWQCQREPFLSHKQRRKADHLLRCECYQWRNGGDDGGYHENVILILVHDYLSTLLDLPLIERWVDHLWQSSVGSIREPLLNLSFLQLTWREEAMPCRRRIHDTICSVQSPLCYSCFVLSECRIVKHRVNTMS